MMTLARSGINTLRRDSTVAENAIIMQLRRRERQTAMDRLQSLVAFAKVVESGSFARAAERLDVSVSAVSRHVAELEAHLGVRLLNRTTRRLSLTESGQAFHERCVQLLADLEEAEEAITLCGDRAARHAAADGIDQLRRPLPRERDRRVPAATSAVAIRDRAVRPRRRSRRRGPRPRDPHRRHRQQGADRTPDRRRRKWSAAPPRRISRDARHRARRAISRRTRASRMRTHRRATRGDFTDREAHGRTRSR